jgi:hypothetical protein
LQEFFSTKSVAGTMSSQSLNLPRTLCNVIHDGYCYLHFILNECSSPGLTVKSPRELYVLYFMFLLTIDLFFTCLKFINILTNRILSYNIWCKYNICYKFEQVFTVQKHPNIRNKTVKVPWCIIWTFTIQKIFSVCPQKNQGER